MAKKTPSKLLYKEWIEKFFGELGHNYYLLYDTQVRGFSFTDLGFYTKEELKEEYKKYQEGSSEEQEIYEM